MSNLVCTASLRGGQPTISKGDNNTMVMGDNQAMHNKRCRF